MSFQKSSNSWRAKAHLGGVKLPVLVGVTALAVLVIAVAAAALVGAASSDGLTILAADEESEDEEELAEGSEDGSGDSDADEAESAEDDSGTDAGEEPSTIVVYVCGAVVSPGVFELEEGARIQDAILAAGGFSDDAATESLNLASLVEDGEQIDVPTLEELEEAEAAGIELTTTTTSSSTSDSSSDGSSDSSSTGLININTATAEELEELPGIGEVTAANIVADREENGPFSSIEDITRVSGIGDAKYAAIADLICVE